MIFLFPNKFTCFKQIDLDKLLFVYFNIDQ